MKFGRISVVLKEILTRVQELERFIQTKIKIYEK